MNYGVWDIDENIRLDFWNALHESFLYTHLGRADLIKFNSWLKRKYTKIQETKHSLENYVH
jgi:hypothetical protein